jgi:hypothetical protein
MVWWASLSFWIGMVGVGPVVAVAFFGGPSWRAVFILAVSYAAAIVARLLWERPRGRWME